jgi:DNA repair protein RadC
MSDRKSIADSASTQSFETTSSSRLTRPQKRAIAEGIESLADAELIANLLCTGGGEAPIATQAAALLEEHRGAAGLARAGIGELSERSGIGRANAVRVAAAIELGRRAMLAASFEDAPILPDCDAVVAWARPKLATLDHEELWVLLVDGRNGLRAARRVASGGIHGLHVGIRDVLRVAIREAASAFVLVHNHPSGDPTPSPEDRAFTRAVTNGAKLVGCPLLDHVIVARQRSSSMLDVISAI